MDTVRRAIFTARELPRDAHALNAASWTTAAQPNRPRAEYDLGLQLAEAAVRSAPGNLVYLNTLGVSQYRVGDFPQALETLNRSRELSSKLTGEPHPVSVAFSAMAHHQLGHIDEAKKLLDRLRTMLQQPTWKANAEAQRFLREAETLIKGEK